MAWYTSHTLRYRGRLLEVGSRYGCLNGASVLKGKPLEIEENSRDWHRVRKLFDRSANIQDEIQNFIRAMDERYG